MPSCYTAGCQPATTTRILPSGNFSALKVVPGRKSSMLVSRPLSSATNLNRYSLVFHALCISVLNFPDVKPLLSLACSFHHLLVCLSEHWERCSGGRCLSSRGNSKPDISGTKHPRWSCADL